MEKGEIKEIQELGDKIKGLLSNGYIVKPVYPEWKSWRICKVGGKRKEIYDEKVTVTLGYDTKTRDRSGWEGHKTLRVWKVAYRDKTIRYSKLESAIITVMKKIDENIGINERNEKRKVVQLTKEEKLLSWCIDNKYRYGKVCEQKYNGKWYAVAYYSASRKNIKLILDVIDDKVTITDIKIEDPTLEQVALFVGAD